ncbi:hypothetical protein ACP4OV_018751 [Aristida adscensionis]
MAAAAALRAVVLSFLLCAAAAAAGRLAGAATGGEILMADRFRAWQAAYNRTYATAAERRRRFKVYRRNVEHIEATNRRGGLSYVLGENQFADLTGDEFRATYTMSPATVRAGGAAAGEGGGRNGSFSDDDAGGAVPGSVDWRSKGAVTSVRTQNTCGSCWAFAPSIEGLYKLKTGHLVPLSEQELVDCDTPGDHGCDGGYPGVAMRWVARNGGLATAWEYPYESRQGECRRDKVRSRTARIRGGEPVARDSEAALERAVARQPVTCSSTPGASSSTAAACSRAPATPPRSTTPSRWSGTAPSPAPAAASTGSSRTRGARRGARRDTCEWRGASRPRKACAASPPCRTTR